MTNNLIDSHAHLELEPLVNDSAGVVERATAAGVIAIVSVGIDISDAEKVLEIADRFKGVFASLGFHPHNAKDAHDGALSRMEELARRPKVVAYGEIGLDFFGIGTTIGSDESVCRSTGTGEKSCQTGCDSSSKRA